MRILLHRELHNKIMVAKKFCIIFTCFPHMYNPDIDTGNIR